MRYVWAFLLALVALLGVSTANAATPDWENGVLTAVTIDRSGESCWSAYSTARKHGVRVDWQEVKRLNSCRVVHLGDTIRMPAQQGQKQDSVQKNTSNEAATQVATIVPRPSTEDIAGTPATVTPSTEADGAQVVPGTTHTKNAPATTGMDVNTRTTAAQTMPATVEFRPVPRARPENLIHSKPATPKKKGGAKVGKATVETGSTRAMAPKECDDVCEANLAVLARINTTMVETGPAEAGHVAPKDGTGITTYHDPWRAVLVGCDNSIGCVEIRKQCEQALEPASRVRCYYALVAKRDRKLPYVNLTGFPELEEIARNDALAQLAQLKDSKEIDLDEDFAGVEERHDS